MGYSKRGLKKIPDLIKQDEYAKDIPASFISDYPEIALYELVLSKLKIIIPRVIKANKAIEKLQIITLVINSDQYGNPMLSPPLFKLVSG